MRNFFKYWIYCFMAITIAIITNRYLKLNTLEYNCILGGTISIISINTIFKKID